MAIDGIELTTEDVAARVHALFEAAKAKDEFEFACTLLRVRGLEDFGWDPFVETHQLVADLLALIAAPLVPHTQVRLSLLLYSHLTEVDAVYEILANLTRVITGSRYVMDPFLDSYPRNRKGEAQFLSTSGRVRALKEMLSTAGHPELAEAIDWFFDASVRNAFAHADYTLHQDKFRTSRQPFEIGGVVTPELHLSVISDIVNRALTFYDVFMGEYHDQRASYKTNKVVTGRFSGGEDFGPVELLADPGRGLHGFQSPPASRPAKAE